MPQRCLQLFWREVQRAKSLDSWVFPPRLVGRGEVRVKEHRPRSTNARLCYL